MAMFYIHLNEVACLILHSRGQITWQVANIDFGTWTAIFYPISINPARRIRRADIILEMQAQGLKPLSCQNSQYQTHHSLL